MYIKVMCRRNKGLTRSIDGDNTVDFGVTHCQSVAQIYIVADVLCHPLKIVMPCLTPHCPVLDKWLKSVGKREGIVTCTPLLETNSNILTCTST